MPAKLYKYRSFNVQSLRMVTEAELFYAQPTSFNDPMDCDPTIEIDLSRATLEKLLYKLLLQAQSDEKARKSIGYLRYMSSEYGDFRTEPSVEDYLKRMLVRDIKIALDSELGSAGVLTFSATWASPLMWSHYADEHRGFCIEYDTSGMDHPSLKPIDYRLPRAIKVSDIAKWKLRDDQDAQQRVFQSYYYAKSSEWKYEKEWRDLKDRSGARGADYQITAIHFGMRCDMAVIVSIVKLLNDQQNIKLYEITPREDSFKLRRRLVDRDEIEAVGVREPPFMMFPDLIATDEEEVVVEDNNEVGAPPLDEEGLG